MPIITVQLGKGCPIETKRRLVSALTSATVDVLEVRPSGVTVLLEEYERENWSSAGDLLVESRAAAFGPAPPEDTEAFFRKPAKAASPPANAPARKAAAKSPRRR